MDRIDFAPFHYLILDSSFFINELDDALCAELGRYCDPDRMPFLCASSTFHSEVRQYTKLLARCPDQLDVYTQNMKKLRRNNVRLYINNQKDYRDYSNIDGTPRHDTWSLIRHLLRINRDAKLLVLTGNELLLRRIVLSDLPVSIYDFKQRALLSPEALARRKEKYELDLSQEVIALEYSRSFKRGDTLVLYDSPDEHTRTAIDLTCDLTSTGNELSDAYRGTEADFFSVKGHPELVAKVYGKMTFSREIARNIEDMKRFHDSGRFPWAIFPETLLYDGNGNPAGYLMKKLDASALCLQEIDLFNGRPDFENIGDAPYSRTLEICLTILREIAYMSNYDILPMDLSKGNFCIHGDDLLVYLLDTCSFCFDRFYSDKHEPGMDAQYIDISHTPMTKLVLIDVFLDFVHQFIMSLMIGGLAPGLIRERKGAPIVHFVEEGTREREMFDYLVPQNLRQLYWTLYSDQVKEENRSPFSIEVLMEELDSALAVVEAAQPTYRSLWDNDGHQGDPYPPRPEDILPSTYGGDVPIHVLEHKQVVIERPKYLQPKTPPQIHAIPDYPPTPSHSSRIGRAAVDPLPPVYVGKSRSGRGLRIFLMVLALLVVLLGADMLRFSGSELGFSLAEYWTARLESIRTSIAEFGKNISAWFSDVAAFFAGLFQ